jgi:hypothetical protein
VCEGGGWGGSATVLSSSERTVRAPGLSDTFAKLSMPQTAQEVPLPPLFPTTSPRLLFATLYSRPRRTWSKDSVRPEPPRSIPVDMVVSDDARDPDSARPT